LAWGEFPGLHPHAKFFGCGFKNVGLKPPKFVFLTYILPKRVYPLKQFCTKFGAGRDSQVPTVTPTFTIVALKMWPYGWQNRQK